MFPQVSKSQLKEEVGLVHSVTKPEQAAVQPEIQQLLTEYKHLFKESTTLPPERQYDHHIDLIPGAQPVNVRHYRYAPAQKSEIEKQLTEMLRNGTIRSRTSPYRSLVLLVIKKDGTW